MASALVEMRCAADFATVCANLEQAIVENKFGVVGKVDIKSTLISKGEPFEKDLIVYQVCNPKKASAVLSQTMTVSSLLPCRVSVYSEDDQVVVSFVDPAAMISMDIFAGHGLEDMAKEVSVTMRQIATDTMSKSAAPQ